ncbi:MAG: hypothetical protein KAT28_04555 [Candidatus Aenigmarchaeota archaeon]|nr:hypothetical protein [Candidatus Aenigmarchaeota archaeon]
MTNNYLNDNRGIIELGSDEKIYDLGRGSLYCDSKGTEGEVFLGPKELKWFHHNYAPLKSVLKSDNSNLKGIGELKWNKDGTIDLTDTAGEVYKNIMEKEPDFSFLRYISELGLERTGLAGGETGEGLAEIKKGFWERNPKFRKGVALANMGFLLGCGAYGLCSLYDLYTKPKISANEDLRDINIALHEKKFSYHEDNLWDNINISEVVPLNSTIIGYNKIGIFVNLDNEKVPKNIQTFRAIKDFSSLLNLIEKDQISKTDCYEYLTGKQENYPVNIILPISDHPNDIVSPSELISTKQGDCEDYALLYANYYNHKGVSSFIVMDKNHAVAAIGDVPSNPEELHENIKTGKTIIIGSSEYIAYHDTSTSQEDVPVKEILKNLKTKYSDAEICGIVSKDSVWIKKDRCHSNQQSIKPLAVFDIKQGIEYLNMNLSEEQIIALAIEYYEFEGNILKNTTETREENNLKYYDKLKKLLNDPHEKKVTEYLFNESSFKESSI